MKKIFKYIYIIAIFFCVGLVFYGCSTSSTAFSNYELAVENGLFEGTLEEWLESLKGKSAYELAVEGGYSGTVEQWLESLKGKSAYELAVINGYEGDVVSWLTSLFVAEGATTQDLSAQSLFNLGVSLGQYDETSAGYSDFMADYLAIVTDTASSTAVQKVAAKCVNQVVSVYTQDGAGAGVIYEINETEQYTYIITNYHVVVLSTTIESSTTYTPATEIHFYTYGAETVNVTTESEYEFGDKSMMAEYIGGSAAYDIAVLKVSGEDFTKLNSTDAEAVTFADTTNLQVGTTAIAIGNPLAEGIAVTCGVVSIDREIVSVDIAGADRNLTCLRLDAAINGGNSGGGVFDINGNLIGIANAKYSSTEIENVANAILASNVKNVAENIVYFYEQNFDDLAEDNTVGVHRYLIGYSFYTNVNPTSTYDADTFTNNKTCDVIVTAVNENSIASDIGVTVGDIVKGLKIKRAGSENIETIYFDMDYEMNFFMLTVRAGDEIEFIVDRLQSGTTDTYVSTDLNPFTVDALKYTEFKNNAVI